jgi:hypothetical protein
MTDLSKTQDDEYLRIILNRILVCKDYRPALGTRKKVSFDDFDRLYGSDPFYSWFGLNDPLVYAAHRAAGGITSIYRQIGLGCEELFRQVLRDYVGLTQSQVTWSYETTATSGQKRRLSLDGRICLTDISSAEKRTTISRWFQQAAVRLDVAIEIAQALKGIVFEVRQGYKSKDSKRQNADLANAATAYSQGYFPVFLLLSTQVDDDIVERYEHKKWLILRGLVSDSPFLSTYAFAYHVIGYDLAGFFQRNSAALQATIAEILQILLKAGANGG